MKAENMIEITEILMRYDRGTPMSIEGFHDQIAFLNVYPGDVKEEDQKRLNELGAFEEYGCYRVFN